MTFLNPPTFATGDVLSASKVNSMLTDIDTLYGWHYGPWYGCDKQQYDSTGTGETVEGWAGWVILAGNDTLIVTLADFTPGTNVTAKVYFDGVQVGGGAGGYTTAGTKTITLPIGSNGWQPWTPYRVSVVTVRPSGTGELDVTNVYVKRSAVPTPGTLPGFADEATSAASDFNAISDGIRLFEPAMVQPVAGCRGGEEYIVQGANTGWTTVQAWKVQHRLNGIRCSLFLQGPWTAGTISARILFNNTAVNGAEWSVGAMQSQRVTDEAFSVPGSPTIGTFYDVALQIKQSVGWLSGWFVRPDYVYQDQISLPAGYVQTLRWAHGDYAIGDSGGGPMLFDMSKNIGYLDNAITATGIVNIVQREPIETAAPYYLPEQRRFYHTRRWRWLAYKPQAWDAEGPEPAVNWTYDGKTWDSYQLPDLDGEGSFYDLDSSPIAPGMLFYATGCTYAIQSPRPGYE